MLETLYIALTALASVVSLPRPFYGFLYLLMNFMIQPSTTFGFTDGLTQKLNIIVGAVVLLGTFFKKIPVHERKLTVCFALFLLCGLISGFLSFDLKGNALLHENSVVALRYALNRLFFLILLFRCITTRKQCLVFLQVLVFLACCNGWYGIYALRSGSEEVVMYSRGVARATGFQEDPNKVSAILVSVLPLAYYFFLHGKNKLTKRLYIGSIMLLVGGVFVSISRAGLLALGFIGSLLLKRNIKQLSIVFISIALIIFFMSFGKSLFSQRATYKTTRSGSIEFTGAGTGRIRVAIYGIQLWAHNPVWGTGPTMCLVALNKQLGLSKRKSRTGPHNIFIMVLAEYGIIGFLVYGCLYLLSFRAWKRLRQHKDIFFKELAVYAGYCLLGYVVCGMFIPGHVEINLVIALALPILIENIAKGEEIAAAKQQAVAT